MQNSGFSKEQIPQVFSAESCCYCQQLLLTTALTRPSSIQTMGWGLPFFFECYICTWWKFSLWIHCLRRIHAALIVFPFSYNVILTFTPRGIRVPFAINSKSQGGWISVYVFQKVHSFLYFVHQKVGMLCFFLSGSIEALNRKMKKSRKWVVSEKRRRRREVGRKRKGRMRKKKGKMGEEKEYEKRKRMGRKRRRRGEGRGRVNAEEKGKVWRRRVMKRRRKRRVIRKRRKRSNQRTRRERKGCLRRRRRRRRKQVYCHYFSE